MKKDERENKTIPTKTKQLIINRNKNHITILKYLFCRFVNTNKW
jgi:hypothetical protein